MRNDVGGTVVAAAITNEAADVLGPTTGQEASAVVRASDVLIALDGTALLDVKPDRR